MKLGGENGLDHIGVITLDELCNGGYDFFIPTYQRGYRWQEDQVNALITDLSEFLETERRPCESYCLKAIVLKRLSEKKYRVVDGQQRLTTILEILKVCPHAMKLFHLSCEEGVERGQFSELCIKNTGSVATNRLAEVGKIAMGLSHINLVWYIIDESLGDAEGYDTYKRLNANKIPLTGAELIRGLYLQSFCAEADGEDVLTPEDQIQLAAEWEQIERRLHDDRFWYMFNRKEPSSYTRIDRLFEIVEQQECSGDLKAAYLAIEAGVAAEIKKEKDGKGEGFRKIDAINARCRKLRTTWQRLLRVFWFLEQCFNDVRMYHYLGYCQRYFSLSIHEYFKQYENSPADFSMVLREKIKQDINLTSDSFSELNYGDSKRKLEKVFVLFNIETINNRAEVDKGLGFMESERFPFARLYATTWNIEHICSQTDNPMNGGDDQIEWAVETLCELNRSCCRYFDDPCTENALTDDIRQWLSNPGRIADVERVTSALNIKIDLSRLEDIGPISFDKIYSRYYRYYASDIPEDVRDRISNLTLLDESTNKGYHNSIFPVKRRKIREAEQRLGRFVPVCTRNVFMKFYTNAPTSLTDWLKSDADAYEDEMKNILKIYFS